MTTDEQYVPDEGQVRAWCREGVGDYPDVMDGWLDRFLARVRRDAAREALDGLAQQEMVRASGQMPLGKTIATHVAESALTYRDTHYPEETP